MLSILALNSGCATNMLLHAVGNRQEVPCDILESYAASNTLAIVYQSRTIPGVNKVRDRVFETTARQAIFDLTRQPDKGRTNVGMIRTNANALVFSPPHWTPVSRTTLYAKPEALLGTNTIVIKGASASWFEVIRYDDTHRNSVVVTSCALPTTRWSTWWKKPVQIVGFPFVVAVDIVSLPLYPIGYGVYVWQMSRGYGPGNHGP